MAPGGFCEKSDSVTHFYRHPGRRLRHDLLGQRVRSNHPGHRAGATDAANSADADTGYATHTADTADSASTHAGGSAGHTAAAFFFDPDSFDPDSVDAGAFGSDSGPGNAAAELEGQQCPGEQHAVRYGTERRGLGQ